jgi:hypothetical protein
MNGFQTVGASAPTYSASGGTMFGQTVQPATPPPTSAIDAVLVDNPPVPGVTLLATPTPDRSDLLMLGLIVAAIWVFFA